MAGQTFKVFPCHFRSAIDGARRFDVYYTIPLDPRCVHCAPIRDMQFLVSCLLPHDRAYQRPHLPHRRCSYPTVGTLRSGVRSRSFLRIINPSPLVRVISGNPGVRRSRESLVAAAFAIRDHGRSARILGAVASRIQSHKRRRRDGGQRNSAASIPHHGGAKAPPT